MVKFLYLDNNNYIKEREIVIERVTNITSQMIELPENIEIEFKTLKNAYGELILDSKFINRIRLDKNLNIKESLLPLIHELIHLNQIFTGRLKANKKYVIWDNKKYTVDLTKLNYEIWSKLPWELDVAKKQHKLLENVINFGLSKI